MRVPVHPRWRGEHSRSSLPMLATSGSSPLARGTPESPEQRGRRTRFIPAGAGNTSRAFQVIRGTPVHPRWRGEHFAGASAVASTGGSSPLARGTLLVVGQPPVGGRFIPAGAGNTRPSRTLSGVSAVHPRWRGEHSRLNNIEGAVNGSSPLARGTPVMAGVLARWLRFIPAGAGNTGARHLLAMHSAVHPRWRGEHAACGAGHDCVCGSSPLARGTPRYRGGDRRLLRFIPAGAGNTNARRGLCPH